MQDFWINNLNILFKDWTSIFPKKNMSRNEILNSLSRFSFFIIILFFTINSKLYWYIIPLIILLTSLFLGNEKDKSLLDDDIKNCRKPTNNNPYMNILQYDDSNIPACKYSSDVDKKYKFNLYQNSKDLFDNKHLERQFYTMPVNTLPNDIVTFGKWLYGTKGNCKYDGTRCLQYEDERYH